MNHNFFATSGITVPYIVMTAYEQLRNENIRRNEEFLNTLFPKGETIIPIVKLKNKKKVQEESNILPKRKSNRLLSSHQDNNVHLGPLVDGVLINNNNNNNNTDKPFYIICGIFSRYLLTVVLVILCKCLYVP
jgi:hypothetical protein